MTCSLPLPLIMFYARFYIIFGVVKVFCSLSTATTNSALLFLVILNLLSTRLLFWA